MTRQRKIPTCNCMKLNESASAKSNDGSVKNLPRLVKSSSDSSSTLFSMAAGANATEEDYRIGAIVIPERTRQHQSGLNTRADSLTPGRTRHYSQSVTMQDVGWETGRAASLVDELHCLTTSGSW